MAIIMAVLIVAALAVIIVTIYGRLTAANSAKEIQQNELVIPADSLITGASLDCASVSQTYNLQEHQWNAKDHQIKKM